MVERYSGFGKQGCCFCKTHTEAPKSPPNHSCEDQRGITCWHSPHLCLLLRCAEHGCHGKPLTKILSQGADGVHAHLCSKQCAVPPTQASLKVARSSNQCWHHSSLGTFALANRNAVVFLSTAKSSFTEMRFASCHQVHSGQPVSKVVKWNLVQRYVRVGWGAFLLGGCSGKSWPLCSAKAHNGAPVPLHTLSITNCCLCRPNFRTIGSKYLRKNSGHFHSSSLSSSWSMAGLCNC